ncbi:hypothetical protein RRG08_057349 [Elysia crispata]|uniref:Uncharacterized protein n=1 Tax=Elysia crispata TaxID=231223 RepID=A0AAE0YL07_9GAST|nr:hypothetical protein RRG08_057349 [Elysia crispata]
MPLRGFWNGCPVGATIQRVFFQGGFAHDLEGVSLGIAPRVDVLGASNPNPKVKHCPEGGIEVVRPFGSRIGFTTISIVKVFPPKPSRAKRGEGFGGNTNESGGIPTVSGGHIGIPRERKVSPANHARDFSKLDSCRGIALKDIETTRGASGRCPALSWFSPFFSHTQLPQNFSASKLRSI